ncbi:MAG: hypothetical protein ACTS3R_18890 [Inquilinaceae bacterium]
MLKKTDSGAVVQPPFHVVVPVWGKEYVTNFLKYALPAHLASGNLDTFGRNHGGLFRIFTKKEDYPQLESAVSYRRLCETVEVKVEFIDTMFDPQKTYLGVKYEVKSQIYRQCLSDGFRVGAVVALVNADIILAKGFYEQVMAAVVRGARVVEVAAPRASARGFKLDLDRIRKGDTATLSVEPIDLARIWYRNIHPLLKMHFVDGIKGEAFHPSHLYWDVDGEGVIMRCFHIYPIVVYPERDTVEFTTTVDDDLVDRLYLKDDQRFVARDSTKIFCCEMSPEDHYVGHITQRGEVDRIVDFFRAHPNKDIEILRREIWIPAYTQNLTRWREQSRAAEKWTERIIHKYQKKRTTNRITSFLNSRLAKNGMRS